MSIMSQVDHLVTAAENRRLGIHDSTPAPQLDPSLFNNPESDSDKQEPNVQENLEQNSEPNEQPEQLIDAYASDESKQVTEDKETKNESVDEYGNPIAPKKTYTEDEVQRMIRERVSRIKTPVQNQKSYEDQLKQSYQQPQQNQQEIGEDNWEKQLESFIDQRLEQRYKAEQLRSWQEKEIQRQTEFEQKFSIGMERYSDFRDVVANKPITDAMMLAIRNLDNPAAFIYGASKLHPAEIDKIAKIEDDRIQAMEMGKLHERMIKERKMVSSAPRPIEPAKSDMELKDPMKIPSNYQSSDYQHYISKKIEEYAKSKRNI